MTSLRGFSARLKLRHKVFQRKLRILKMAYAKSFEWCQNAQKGRFSIPSLETKTTYLQPKKVI